MTQGEEAGAQTRPILLAGPTASGKSALALAIAERTGGVVINADSQQVYGGWRILTARPGPEEEARAPHRLYGHVPLEAAYSTGAWLRDCVGALAEARAGGRRAIVVGGTGLYFKALTEGIAPIPQVPPETRREAEAALERDGLAASPGDWRRATPRPRRPSTSRIRCGCCAPSRSSSTRGSASPPGARAPARRRCRPAAR